MPSQIMMSVSGKIRIEMAQDGAALVLLHNSGECQRDTPHESSDRLALAWWDPLMARDLVNSEEGIGWGFF